MTYCTNCGNAIEETVAYCPHCGKATGTKNESFTDKLKREANEFVTTKDPFVAAILSFFFPGLGQLYNGEFKKGLMIQIGCIVSWFFCSLIPFFILVPIGILFAGIYDAYTEADKIKKGENPNKNVTLKELLIFLLWPFVMIGILIVIVMILIILAAIVFAIFGSVIAIPFGYY